MSALSAWRGRGGYTVAAPFQRGAECAPENSAKGARIGQANHSARCFARSIQLVMLTLKGYGDESSDEKAERVFLVCAVIGLEPEWQRVEQEWRDLLGNRVFHSRNWRDAATFDTLVALVGESSLFSVVGWLDLKAEATRFPDRLRGVSYLTCFTTVLLEAGVFVEEMAKALEEQFCIELVFDHRKQSETAAAMNYSRVVNWEKWATTDLFKKRVTFESSRDHVRLQVADLVASVVRRDLDRTPEARKMKTPHRRALKVKMRGIGDKFLSWCVDPGDDRARYGRWLLATGRYQKTKRGELSIHDNMVNRLIFGSRDLHHKKR